MTTVPNNPSPIFIQTIDITGYLPGIWDVTARHQGATAIRQDGLALDFYPGSFREKGRLVVSMRQCKSVTGYTFFSPRRPAPSITCARTRTPQAIAGDIQRRLLPDVEEAFRQESAYIADCNAQHDYQQQARRILAEAGRGRLAVNSVETVVSGNVYGQGASWTAQVSSNPDYGVSLEIRWLDLETAAALLETIAAAYASG